MSQGQLCLKEITVLSKPLIKGMPRPMGALKVPCGMFAGHSNAHTAMLEIEGGELVGKAKKFASFQWTEGPGAIAGEVIKGTKIEGHE